MRKFLDTVLILCLISLSFTPEDSARSVYQPARGGTTDQCNDGEVDYVTYDSPNLRIFSEGVANIVMRLSNPIDYANAVSVPFITVDNFGSAVGGTSCDTDVDYIISLPDNPVISGRRRKQ